VRVILSELFGTISHANYYATLSAVMWHITST